MSLLSNTADTFYAFRFLRLLTTPWEKTGAFEAGLIDEKGTVIRKPQTSDERAVLNLFHRLVFNVKRLLNKIPFGKSTIASYITALFLLKEHLGCSEAELINCLNEANLSTDFLGLLTEDSQVILAEGFYTLAQDVASPMTGEVFAKKGTVVIVESNVESCGSLFGTHMFRVLHQITKTKLTVCRHDLDLNN
jgi:hypothetical protein